jgi:hypothetical protein
MLIIDRLVRRQCARSLEALVREAVGAQLATMIKDPLHQPLIYGDATRLHIPPTALVNNALFNLSSGEITVGQHAFFGHNVAILTGTHDFTQFGADRQVHRPEVGWRIGCRASMATADSPALSLPSQAPCRLG